jgi:tungstate transport system permease protein
MDSFTESARVALGLVAGGDPRLWAVVALSLQVSALACLLAGAFGLAAGAWLAVAQFPGRRMVLTLVNTLLALPSVVVGLVMYLLLSRSGPLGSLGLLFSPTAMVLAQAVLVLPVLTALTRQAIEGPWRDHGDQIRSLGAPRWLGGCLLLWDERLAILTVLLTAFGRAVSEVGAVMVVGGNIDGFTRVMTTTIALETSKGDLPLALGLGLVLLGVVLALNAAGAGLGLLARQRRGAGHA